MTEDQFTQAYDDYADAIFRHCFFRVYNRELARDIMQETFRKTWEYVLQGKELENPRAFLYRVATNLIIDNSRKRHESSLDELTEEGFQPSSDDHIDTYFAAEGKMLHKFLNELSPAHKEVITLRYIDSLSVKEIAQSLGESENVISVRLHRGMKELRKAFDYV